MKRRRFRIPVPGLPEHLRGFRCTQVSDLHLGIFDGRTARLADAVNAEEPEAIFLTGDLINRRHRLEPVVEFLSLLRPRFGAWAVLGNWEHNWRLDVDVIRREFAAQRVTLLVNEAEPMIAGDPALYVAGVDDAIDGDPDMSAALSRVPAGAATILLSHHPCLGPEAARRGVVLTLSGHTHGGQFVVPGLPMPWLRPVERKFRMGLHPLPGGYLHVSAGLGTTGPHLRFGAPCEIATFQLWPAARRDQGWRRLDRAARSAPPKG